MADFTQINQEIDDNINTNGVGAITGAKLNTVLRDMISSVNAAKADKVTGATVGDFVGLDNNGNLTDSGSKASDFATAAQGVKADMAYQKPQSGIPSTDFAAAVQTSLGKADTAVQQVTVGTTTTGNAGTNASVTNSGTDTNPVFDFTIPRGDNGQGISYKNADDVSDLPTPSSSQSAYIYLIPSTTEQGVVDQYACIENAVVEGQVVSGWSWVLIGTTAPVVSVQRVDTYQPILPVKTVGSYVTKSTGGFTSSSTLETVIYDISDAKKLVCDFTVINAGNLALSFFDDNLDLNDLSTASSHYLGWRVDKNTPPYVVTANTQFENQVINVDSDATLGNGDVTGARYVGLTRLISNHFGGVSVLTPVPQSLVKKQPIALNEILIFNTLIQLPQIWNSDTADATEITTQQTLSTWGIVFPSTYTNTGKPTQVVAMLHGLSGYVANGVLGHSGAGWVASRQAYLDAGFAVMDVNGFGAGDSDDADSRPWGNPASVETLDKAFEYLKENYNVCEKLLIAGVSMGAILAMSYAKNFPGKVSAVACFAPNLFAYSSRYVGSEITKATSWGYASLEQGNTDGWKHTIGYVVLSVPMVIDSEGYAKKYEWPTSKPNDWPENLDALQLVDYFPVPIRVWQGTADTEVSPNGSKLLVHSLRRGNSNATLRLCSGAGHSVQNEQYVRNEAVSWFKRFVN